MLEIGLRSVWAQHVWMTMAGSSMLQQCAPCASGPHGTAIVQTPSLVLEQMSLPCMTVNSPNTSHMISSCLIWIRILTIGLHARCVIRPFRRKYNTCLFFILARLMQKVTVMMFALTCLYFLPPLTSLANSLRVWFGDGETANSRAIWTRPGNLAIS
jgi:hypothetical protein